MTHHHIVSECLVRFVARMRDRVPDAICAGRIERFLERSARADAAQRPDAHEARDMGIKRAVAQMEPLTRGILILVVERKMSVLEVARIFRMSEERVCRHFRLAAQMVMKYRGGGDGA
ncbi:hypothetical protein [Sphingobium sp. AP50]|uniref:hypothetical protein n=1 Tax=Sphingobium sp. AP50 TaxID=1884369 RepID=UPI001C433EAA|nr:hypothetical protein [Sphingobium sp. AP50]